jgi:branched-subunit amino acid transport protein
MGAWLTMLAVGVATYATRLSFFVLFRRMSIPDGLRRALRFVPPAVFSAIIFPELLIESGRPLVSLENERLIAGVVAGIVGWRSHNVLLTVVIGMIVLLLLRALA